MDKKLLEPYPLEVDANGGPYPFVVVVGGNDAIDAFAAPHGSETAGAEAPPAGGGAAPYPEVVDGGSAGMDAVDEYPYWPPPVPAAPACAMGAP